MTWSALITRPDSHVIVDVDGLDVDVDYTCKFTQEDNDEIVKTADGEFVGDKGRKMDCGEQPTGFAISDTKSAVLFELFIKGKKTQASYAGPAGAGPVVQLSACQNGAVRVFRLIFALEDAIGSHTCSLEANTRVTMVFLLGVHCSLPPPS
jgi:hypothetical protein